MERLVPINVVAEYLTVSPKTVYHWAHIGFIPYYKFPKAIRFKMSEVDRWARRRYKRGRVTERLEVSL